MPNASLEDATAPLVQRMVSNKETHDQVAKVGVTESENQQFT